MKRLLTTCAVAIVALLVSAEAHAQGAPQVTPMAKSNGNCSECEMCPINEDYDWYRNTNVVLEPGQELPGYILGDGSQFGCRTACSDLISCRAPMALSSSDLKILAAALGASVDEAHAYADHYGVKSLSREPSANAVELLGCGGVLVAYLPIGGASAGL
jgi:hypothetical protein